MELDESESAPSGESRNLEQRLLHEAISYLHPSPALTVPLEGTLQQAVGIMQTRHVGCVLVVDGGGLLKGIFTERDLLNRVAGKGLDWSKAPVADYMTADPESLHADDAIVWALNLMHVGGYRHVPITDAAGKAVGVISVKDVVEFIVDLFPSQVLNLPPDPHRRPSSDWVGGGED